MLKRGVTRNDEFARRALAEETAGRGWWPFSYTLLAELEDAFRPEDEPLLERLYRSMAAGEGVWKITRRGRFAELDGRLVGDCRERFAAVPEILVHDAAASSAATSLELFRAFSGERRTRLLASDRYESLALATPPGTGWTVVFDADGRAIQATDGRVVLSMLRPDPWRYPINRLLRARVASRVVPQARNLLGREDGPYLRRVRLFHPEAVREANAGRGFSLARHDIFQASPGAFHVVRAMNVLTPHHFAPERVREGIAACAAGLADGGVLLLGRSADERDGSVHATAYAVEGERLVPLWRHGEGYEWHELATQARVPRP